MLDIVRGHNSNSLLNIVFNNICAYGVILCVFPFRKARLGGFPREGLGAIL
jgi:hypothetical protein